MRHQRSKSNKISWKFARRYSSFVSHPNWYRPMPKCYERFHSSFAQCLNNFPIMFNFFKIKLPFCWFDSRPFNRKTMGVVAEGLRDIKVLAKAVVVVARATGYIILRRIFAAALFRKARGVFFLPLRPVVMIIPLDLMGGSRRSPEKIFWKF